VLSKNDFGAKLRYYKNCYLEIVAPESLSVSNNPKYEFRCPFTTLFSDLDASIYTIEKYLLFEFFLCIL
jgi:hypothetical protein